MYIIDGIAYAGEPVEGIEVSHARYVGERVLLVTFSTGETRLFDASCRLSMPAFEPRVGEGGRPDLGRPHGLMTRTLRSALLLFQRHRHVPMRLTQLEPLIEPMRIGA